MTRYLIAFYTIGTAALAHAGTLYWNDSTGTGVWNSNTSNYVWSDDGGVASAYVDNSDVYFSSAGAASTASVGSALNAYTLHFEKNITLSGSSTITVTGALNNSNINVSSGVTASYAGVVKLSNNGAITVGSGSALTLGSLTNGKTVAIGGGGTLVINTLLDAAVNIDATFVSVRAGYKYKGGSLANGATLVLNSTSDGATRTANVYTGSTFAGTSAGGVKLVLQDATATVCPGDMSTSGFTSIGKLTLAGLTANSGGKFNFDINSAGSDLIDTGASAVTLGGVMSIYLFSDGTVNTDTAYTLIQGTGAWSASNLSFVFSTLPAGYVLDASYGNGAGYVLDTTAGSSSLTVKLAAVPEPAALSLLTLGGLVLAFRRRG